MTGGREVERGWRWGNALGGDGDGEDGVNHHILAWRGDKSKQPNRPLMTLIGR